MGMFFGSLFAGIAIFIVVALVLSKLNVKKPNKIKSIKKEYLKHDLGDFQNLKVIETPKIITEYKEDSEDSVEIESTINTSAYVTKEKIITLYILSKGEIHFQGYELFQALLAGGLIHGDMDIFHKYEQIDDQKTLIFSLASAEEPGNFDINNIGGLSCIGLCLFRKLACTTADIHAFKSMHQTALVITEELGGVLCDSIKQPFTDEVLEQYYQEIQANITEDSLLVEV